MKKSKSNPSVFLIGVLNIFIFFIFISRVASQTLSYGVFGIFEPANIHTNTNEKTLLTNLGLRYLFGCVNYQDNLMTLCRDGLEGAIKMDVERDLSGHMYPFEGGTDNRIWKYICKNPVANINTAEIDLFVQNVYNRYAADLSGMASIMVAHQGHTDHATHWGFIEHACQQIQTRFGDNVRSLAITEVATSHLDPANLPAFVAAIPHLDIFLYECYPLSTYGATTPPPLAYCGAPLQTALQMVVDGYTWCQSAFEQNGNGNTQWHAIIQVCEQLEYDPTPPPPANSPLYSYHRRPTEAEIFCQANLALSRGAKGIYTYLYGSTVTAINFSSTASQSIGIVTYTGPRNPINPTYNHVANLFSYLDDIGPELITKTCTAAFNCNTIPGGQYITGVTGYTNDGTTHTIEIGIFSDATYPNRDYFMLVNRLCSNAAGNPANPQVITLQTTRSNAAYRIRDVVTGETYISYNGTFPQIVIGPGRARLFELCPVFTTHETWGDSVHIYCDCTLPANRILTIQSGGVVEFDPVGDNSGGGRDSQRAELMIQGESANGAKFTSRNTSGELQDLASGEPARLRKPVITAKSGKTAEAIRLSTALPAAKAGTNPEKDLLLQQEMLDIDDLKTAVSIRDCSDDFIRPKSILSDFRECSVRIRTGPSQRDLHSQNSI